MNYNDIIKRGLELGLEEIELYVKTKEGSVIKLFRGNLEESTSTNLTSMSIRGLHDGKMGYALTESFDEEAIEFALNKVLENAKMLTATEKEFIYDGSGDYKEIAPQLSNAEEFKTIEKVNLLKQLESNAYAKDPRIVNVGYCQYSETKSNTKIINSKGLNLDSTYSYITVVLGAVAAENGQSTMGFYGDVQFDLNKFDLNKIVDKCTDEALAKLGAGSVTTGSYDIVLKESVMTDILSAFSSVFSGDAAMKNLTILKDKENTKVFGENITIVDDPFCETAVIKIPFDDEGVPCATRKVVENGVFTGLLHNQATANFFKTKSTGHGFKPGVSAAVKVSTTNFYLAPGENTLEQLFEKAGDGLYITDVAGLHAGLNPVSGDFNVQSSGFIIKDGKKASPVTLFVMSGNFFELLNNVVALGNDIDDNFIGTAAPSVLVKGLKISGK